jgi:hypothetical protein
MRDWIIVLAPLMGAVYFLIYPRQFAELAVWLTALVQ